MSGGRDTAGEDPQLEWGGYDALGTDPRTLRAVIGRLEGELRDEQRARHDAERQLARARHRSAPRRGGRPGRCEGLKHFSYLTESTARLGSQR